MNGNNGSASYDAAQLDSLEVKHIQKEIRKFIGNKNKINICRIQTYKSIMHRYFCTGFIDFMLKGTTSHKLSQRLN